MAIDKRFEASFSESNLRKVFDERVANNGSIGRDGLHAGRLTKSQLDSVISSASERVLNGTYSFAPYRQMLKMKGAGKPPRQIAIPSLRDRVVLRVMAEYVRELEPSLELKRPQEIVSGVRGAIRSRTDLKYARFDVVNFYPTICHNAIESALIRIDADSRFVRLVKGAVSTPILADGKQPTTSTRVARGVPPGVSLSNVLGELILSDMDRTLSTIPRVSYFRYVDDVILFAGRLGIWRASMLLKFELRKAGLRTHPRRAGKSGAGIVEQSSIEYLGYTFESAKVTVSLARAQRLISSMARPVTALKYAVSSREVARVARRSEWWMNLSITGCVAGGTRRGWLPYYSQLDDVSLLHKLDYIAFQLTQRVPASHRFEPKSFVRAYTLTRNPSRDKTGYIPNLDNMTYREKRALLRLASKYDRIPTKKVDVDKLFARFVGTAIASLETDVGTVS